MQHQSFDSHCETLPRTDPSRLQDGDSPVELVRLFYIVVVRVLAYHRRHRIPASTLLLKSAKAVARRMGCLYCLLKKEIEEMEVTVPWDERGPKVCVILDLEFESFFEAAFERLVLVERKVISEWAIGV